MSSSAPIPTKQAPPLPPPRRSGVRSPPPGAFTPSLPSQYLMNNIPRGTKRVALLNYLLAPPNTRYAALQALSPQPDVHCGVIITDSRLDDELSVATIEFSNTPSWLQDLREDPCGFPKPTPLGTLWLGLNRHSIDADGRSAFMRAVIDGENLLYAEMLAEFHDTPVNIQDKDAMSALHWACTIQRPIMVQLCLSIPDLATGLRDSNNRTAFDIAMHLGNEPIASMFYVDIMTIEDTDPRGALLRALAITADPDRTRPVFPGAALFAPVQSGDESLVEALIDRGVDLQARNSDGDTALHVAAGKAGGVAIACRLLEAGADVGRLGAGGATPLHRAVKAGDHGMVATLLRRNADVAVADADGMVAVDLAKQGGHAAITLLLMAHGEPVDLKEQGGSKGSGLENSNKQVDIALLVEGGISPVAGTTPEDITELVGGQQAPHHTLDDRPSKVATIIAPIASINREPQPVTAKATHTLLKRSDIPVTQLDNTQATTALIKAVCEKDMYRVRELLRMGARWQGNGGETWQGLHRAVESDSIDIVGMLLAAGADINAADSSGATVLHRATAGGQWSMVKLLLAARPNVNAVDNKHATPLHWAVRPMRASATPGPIGPGRVMEILSLLLSGGADVHVANSDGASALHLAASIREKEIVDALLAVGANSNAIDKTNRTPLHLTILGRPGEEIRQIGRAGSDLSEIQILQGEDERNAKRFVRSAEIVTTLLDAAANTKAMDLNGDTALHLAADIGARGIVELLLDRGALVGATDIWGMTALHRAAYQGHAPTVQKLVGRGSPLEARARTREHLALFFPHRDILPGPDLRTRAWRPFRSSRGPTALHLAAECGREQVVRILLASGAAFDSPGETGTPLDLAAKNGNVGIVKLLNAAEAAHALSSRISSGVTLLGLKKPSK